MMNTVNGLMTLVLIILFVGIWVWAWSSRNKEKFNRMARLPMEDNADSEEAKNDD